MSISLRFNGLTIGWNGSAVGRDLSRDISFSGGRRFLAITGQTGVGKSTLVDTLSGLKAPMEGTVAWTLPGKSFFWDQTWSPAMRRTARSFHRGAATFLLQRGEMIECMTIEDNVINAVHLRNAAAGARAARQQAREQARAIVNEIMTFEERAKHGVEGMLRRYPRQLSGGQTIRMALAISMALDPTVLFVDEPTSSADPLTKKKMFTALGRWATRADTDRAVVCITHDAHFLKDAKVDFDEYRLTAHRANDKLVSPFVSIAAGG